MLSRFGLIKEVFRPIYTKVAVPLGLVLSGWNWLTDQFDFPRIPAFWRMTLANVEPVYWVVLALSGILYGLFEYVRKRTDSPAPVVAVASIGEARVREILRETPPPRVMSEVEIRQLIEDRVAAIPVPPVRDLPKELDGLPAALESVRSDLVEASKRVSLLSSVEAARARKDLIEGLSARLQQGREALEASKENINFNAMGLSRMIREVGRTLGRAGLIDPAAFEASLGECAVAAAASGPMAHWNVLKAQLDLCDKTIQGLDTAPPGPENVISGLRG